MPISVINWPADSWDISSWPPEARAEARKSIEFHAHMLMEFIKMRIVTLKLGPNSTAQSMLKVVEELHRSTLIDTTTVFPVEKIPGNVKQGIYGSLKIIEEKFILS